jgi:hypothetical protein
LPAALQRQRGATFDGYIFAKLGRLGATGGAAWQWRRDGAKDGG